MSKVETIFSKNYNPMGWMISSFKLSPSCICSDEALALFDQPTTCIIDIRPKNCPEDYDLGCEVFRMPHDSTNLVSGFIKARLNLDKANTKTHFIFVCEYGLISENIVRQLFDKDIGDVYHLCGGYVHHAKEMQKLSV